MNLETISFVAEAVKEKDFSKITTEVQENFVKEVTGFIKMSYAQYDIEDSVNFAKLKLDFPEFFSSLQIITHGAPCLLRSSNLSDFLLHIFGYSDGFEGMIEIMEAAETSKESIASMVSAQVVYPEVLQWIKANWCLCEPYGMEIAGAMNAKKLRDKALSKLFIKKCGKPWMFMAFVSGVSCGFIAAILLGLIMYLY